MSRKKNIYGLKTILYCCHRRPFRVETKMWQKYELEFYKNKVLKEKILTHKFNTLASERKLFFYHEHITGIWAFGNSKYCHNKIRQMKIRHQDNVLVLTIA